MVIRTVSARMPGLDTLRALAILVVMLYHLQGALPEWMVGVGQYGWMGVDLFFCLSGYLIGSQLLKPYGLGGVPSLREFYRRRVYRILPAYLFVLMLYVAWPGWREARMLPPLWKMLTFTANLGFDVKRRAFSHVWSLCVEEHFYLALPVLVMGMMRRPSVKKTVGLIGAVVVLGVLYRGYELLPVMAPFGWTAGREAPAFFFRTLYYPTYTRLDGLVAGVALALVRVFRPGWWSGMARRGHVSFLGGAALVGVVAWMFRDGMGAETKAAAWGMVVGLPMLAAGLGLLVASSVSRDGWLSRFRVPGARMVAVLAYSLYLTHKEVAHLCGTYLPGWTAGRDWRAVMVYAVACVGVAAALYFGVERPFMVLRERRGSELVEMEMRREPAL